MRGLEHIVLVITHPQVAIITDYRVQVHIIRVDVEVTLQRSTVPVERHTVFFILSGDERAPLFVRGLVALFVAAITVQASKRKIEGTIILYISYARLCDMRALSVLGLVFVNDFLLSNAELFTSVVLVSGLPRVKLTCYFIINIRTDDLNVGSSTV